MNLKLLKKVNLKKGQYINAFDIETVKKGKTDFYPIFIGLNLYNNDYSFYNDTGNKNIVDDFLTNIVRIMNKHKKATIYAHNLTFDGGILLNQTSIRDLKYESLLINGNIYMLKIKINNKEITFKCSFRLFPSKLSSAYKKLECSKKIEFNHENIKYRNYKNFATEIKKYCLNDVKITIEIINKYKNFLKIYVNDWGKNLINSSYTISSISYNIFLKNFNILSISLEIKRDLDKEIRECYFGGNTQVFGNPCKKFNNIYHYDFPSMYGLVMTEELPHGGYTRFKENEFKEIKKNGFYWVTIKQDMKYPTLPTKNKEGKLVFKNGIIEGAWYGEELLYFLTFPKNEILGRKKAIVFEKYEKVFKEFVTTFMNIKKKNKGKADATIAKGILTSLYGRMGMKERKNETRLITELGYDDFINEKFGKIINETKINNTHIIKYEIELEGDYINSNVTLAAAITSKARIKLHKGIINVHNKGGKILYCDTDSIFAAFNKCVNNEKHGEIYWDEATYKPKIIEASFALPKAYGLLYENGKELIKIKGVSINTTSYSEFSNAFYNNKTLTHKIIKFKKNYKPIIEESLKKTDLSKYDKRTFSKDKKNTKPINEYSS